MTLHPLNIGQIQGDLGTPELKAQGTTRGAHQLWGLTKRVMEVKASHCGDVRTYPAAAASYLQPLATSDLGIDYLR